MAKSFYTKEELFLANNQNILITLNAMGYKLKKEGAFYRGELHSSLVIKNDGRWAWNSKDIKGKAPVELLKQILINDYGYDDKSAYITAIKRLAGTEGYNLKLDIDFIKAIEKQLTEVKGILELPEKNSNCSRVVAYLCKARGLDFDIVKSLIQQNKIYETKEYHNVCFVCYNDKKEPKHAFLRGTLTDKAFKKDVPNSDKNYAFILNGYDTSDKVYCFESSADAIAHASLYKIYDMDYKDGHRISLHGTSFLGLQKFLDDNPQVKEVIACLDYDETGIRRSKKLCMEYSEKGFKTFMQLPREKDYNEQLIRVVNDRCNAESIELLER